MQPFFLAREEREADGALGLDPDGFERAGGLEHRHDPGSVVGRSGAQIPAIDVPADQDDFVGSLGAPGISATVL